MRYFEGMKCKIIERKYLPCKLFKPSTWGKYKETSDRKGIIIQFNDVTKILNYGTHFPTKEYFEVIVQTDDGEVLRLESNQIRIIES